jgi:ribbon-helix-helix CopG family protein
MESISASEPMYGVWGMHRTNIYLEKRQLRALRAIAESRGESVAALIRGALDQWLATQEVEILDLDEWERRFDGLLTRGRSRARERGLTEADVENEVALAVREVRAARRR